MAVKWIAEAAQELGMDVFDAVELLASKQNYPMNGLLDEDRVQFLKLYRGERRSADAAAQLMREAPEPAEDNAEKKSLGPAAIEVGEKTSPVRLPTDRTEDKTVIIPTMPGGL